VRWWVAFGSQRRLLGEELLDASLAHLHRRTWVPWGDFRLLETGQFELQGLDSRDEVVDLLWAKRKLLSVVY
jgi:hypothetical protein